MKQTLCTWLCTNKNFENKKKEKYMKKAKWKMNNEK